MGPRPLSSYWWCWGETDVFCSKARAKLRTEQWRSLDSPTAREGVWPACVVFSEDERVLSHKGNLGETRQRHCSGKVTQGKIYLRLLISCLDMIKLPHQSLFLWLMLKLEDIISKQKAKLESETAELWKHKLPWPGVQCGDGNSEREWAGGVWICAVSTHILPTPASGRTLPALNPDNYKKTRNFVSKGGKTNEVTPRGSF